MSEYQNLISVIIPVYCVEPYLEQCICSVVEQSYHNLDIILVDDGSPDACGEICDTWATRDKRIRVIHKSNGGLSDARNAGLDLAKGDYIAFVDSDDWIEPQMYEVLLNHMIKEGADICGCGIMNAYETKSVPYPCTTCVGGTEDVLPLIYKDTTFPVVAWNKLYKRFLWNGFRFPKGKICEDAFTTYLLVDKAEKIIQISNPLYHYRIRENSIMTATFRPAKMDEEEAWRCNYEYMKKHHPQIGKLAYEFYLQKVNVLIHTIRTEQLQDYMEEYIYLYTILKKNLVYVLFQSRLSLKYRARFLVDFCNLAKPVEIQK